MRRNAPLGTLCGWCSALRSLRSMILEAGRSSQNCVCKLRLNARSALASAALMIGETIMAMIRTRQPSMRRPSAGTKQHCRCDAMQSRGVRGHKEACFRVFIWQHGYLGVCKQQCSRYRIGPSPALQVRHPSFPADVLLVREPTPSTPTVACVLQMNYGQCLEARSCH